MLKLQYIVVALVMTPSSLCADLPLYLKESFLHDRWVAYSPTGNTSTPSSEDSIRKDLEVLRRYEFQGIITYGCDGLKKEIPRLAREAGIDHIIVGVWNPLNDTELRNAKSVAHLADGFCVGNEGLGGESRYTIVQLAEAMEELRKWSGRPVTTSEQLADYWNIPELITLGDWAFPNVHPFWHNQTKEPQASRWTKQQFERLSQKSTSKFVFLKEVGFPTASLDSEFESPTEQLQADYYVALRALEVPYAYFEAFDQPWKQNHPMEPFWGLFNKDREAKRIVQLLGQPKLGIQITSVRNNTQLPVSRLPEGGFFEIEGTASGFKQGERQILVFVATGNIAAPGWFLQTGNNGVITLDNNGRWSARCQIGNPQFPPKNGQRLKLKAIAPLTEIAKRLIELRKGQEDRPYFSMDLPNLDNEWIDEVSALTVQLGGRE